MHVGGNSRQRIITTNKVEVVANSVGCNLQFLNCVAQTVFVHHGFSNTQ